jgi:hypothetical protein
MKKDDTLNVWKLRHKNNKDSEVDAASCHCHILVWTVGNLADQTKSIYSRLYVSNEQVCTSRHNGGETNGKRTNV